MSNTYFRFKQFTINQDKCAMKVCTDACILGAWAAQKTMGIDLKSILDIGTGTGLLTLMIAQKTSAFIDAIEINEDAANQAADNISISNWENKIKLLHTSLQAFKPLIKYELIICNPPFYEGDLKSADEEKNAAKHDSTFSFNELFLFIKDHLTNNGFSIILIPFQRTGYIEKLITQNHLFIKERLIVKQTPAHNYFRTILLLSPANPNTVETRELTIHDAKREYTAEFKALLKDYYLAF